MYIFQVEKAIIHFSLLLYITNSFLQPLMICTFTVDNHCSHLINFLETFFNEIPLFRKDINNYISSKF